MVAGDLGFESHVLAINGDHTDDDGRLGTRGDYAAHLQGDIVYLRPNVTVVQPEAKSSPVAEFRHFSN